jgi:hypothetical protein
LKRDGTRAETRFHLSPKRRSPFKSAVASVQSTAGSRGVRISGSNAGYTTFRGSVGVLTTLSKGQFPLHFPSRASPCAIRFETHCKVIPLHAWTGPECSRRFRLPDFKTTHEVGTVVSRTHRSPVPPGNIPGTRFC